MAAVAKARGWAKRAAPHPVHIEGNKVIDFSEGDSIQLVVAVCEHVEHVAIMVHLSAAHRKRLPKPRCLIGS